MKITTFIIVTTFLSLTACNKNKCYDCHYDGPNGTEVEMGQYCGTDAQELENSGYTDSLGNNYTVHCGEH